MFPSTSATTETASLERAGRISKTIGYYAAFVALGMVGASLGPTLPGLAEHTQTHLGEISFLFTARSLGFLLGSLFGGRLYDRVSGHSLMAVVLGIMAVTMALAPLLSLLWLLAVVLLIMGVAEGTLDVGGNTLLIWVHRHKVGPFMNGLHFFFGAGAFLSPIIIAQTALISGDITWAYWVLALLMLPVIVWLLRLPSPTPQAVSEDGTVGRADHLLVALVALFFFLYTGAEISFGGWIFTYAVALGLSGETAAAYLTSAFWGAITLGRLLTIPVAARLRPRFILLGGLMGCLVSVSVILLWSNTLAAIWLGTLGLGFSMASIFPTTLSLAERRVTITGRVSGWFFAGASAGGMTLPWLIGQFFETIGPRVMMFAILVNLIVAVGVFAVLFFHSGRPGVDCAQDREGV
jgi:fucose permease